MKKTIIVMMLCLSFALVGCENANQLKGDNQTMENIDLNSLDDKEFLIQVYGFTEDELVGIDIDRFKRITKFRDNIQKEERLRMQFDSLKDSLSDGNNTDTFLLLSVESGEKLSEGTKISQIAFYMNAGTFIQKSLFDIDNKVFYVDNDTAHPFFEDLSGITDKYEVFKWKTDTSGLEVNSTGSYEWKLVFLGEDGRKYVYTGYTKDGSHLPDSYNDLSKELIDIIKNN